MRFTRPVNPPTNAEEPEEEEAATYLTLLERVVVGNEQEKELVNNFLCQVCQDVLRDPRECSKCRNVFCSTCIERW
jgi:hypothetical protein